MAEECQDCGTAEDLREAPCPYALELYDDHTPVILCEACAQDRAWDV